MTVHVHTCSPDYLEVEVQHHNHLSFGGLEEGMFDIVEENVHSISLQCCVAKPVSVSLKGALEKTSKFSNSREGNGFSFAWGHNYQH